MFESPTVTPHSLTSHVRIFDGEGNVHSPQGLSNLREAQINVPVLDTEGRLTNGDLGATQRSGTTTSVHVVKLNDGTVVETLPNQSLLGSSGDWIRVKDLSSGHLLKVVVYDPRVRKPVLSVREVTGVTITQLESPVDLYEIRTRTEKNLLITQGENHDESWTLLCMSLSSK